MPILSLRKRSILSLLLSPPTRFACLYDFAKNRIAPTCDCLYTLFALYRQRRLSCRSNSKWLRHFSIFNATHWLPNFHAQRSSVSLKIGSSPEPHRVHLIIQKAFRNKRLFTYFLLPQRGYLNFNSRDTKKYPSKNDDWLMNSLTNGFNHQQF